MFQILKTVIFNSNLIFQIKFNKKETRKSGIIIILLFKDKIAKNQKQVKKCIFLNI